MVVMFFYSEYLNAVGRYDVIKITMIVIPKERSFMARWFGWVDCVLFFMRKARGFKPHITAILKLFNKFNVKLALLQGFLSKITKKSIYTNDFLYYYIFPSHTQLATCYVNGILTSAIIDTRDMCIYFRLCWAAR